MQNVSAIHPVTLAPAAAAGDPSQQDGAFALAFEGEQIRDTDQYASGDQTSGSGVGPVLQAPLWTGLVGDGRLGAGANGPGEPGEAEGELAGSWAGKLVRAEPGQITLIKPAPDPAAVPDLGGVLTGPLAETGDLADPESAVSGDRLWPKGERTRGEPPLSGGPSTRAHPMSSGSSVEGWSSAPLVQMPEIGKQDLSSAVAGKLPKTDVVSDGRTLPVPQAVVARTVADGVEMSGPNPVGDAKPVEEPKTISTLSLPQLADRGDTTGSPADQVPETTLAGLVPTAPSGENSSNVVRFEAIASWAVHTLTSQPPGPALAGQDPVENSAVSSAATAIAGTDASAPNESDATARDELVPANRASGGTDGTTPGGYFITLGPGNTQLFGTSIAPPPDTVRISVASDPAGAESGAGAAITGTVAGDRDPKGLLPGVWERLFNGMMAPSPAGRDVPFVGVSPSVLPTEPTAPGVPSGLQKRENTLEVDPVGQLGHPVEEPSATAPSGATVSIRTGAGPAPQAPEPATRPEDALVPLDESAVPILSANGAAFSGSAQAVGPSQGPTPLPVPHVAAQISAALAQNADGSTDLALSPEELGKVRLKFKPDAGYPDRMVVMITFERPETLDLFRRHAGELADALRSAGYAGADIGFSQEGGFASGSDRREDRSVSTVSPILLDPSDTSPAPARHLVGASLDLRL